MTKAEKIAAVLACPACGEPALEKMPRSWRCRACGATFPARNGTPMLIADHSPVLEWYELSARPTAGRGIRGAARKLQRLKPSDRVWTRRSIDTLKRALRECRPEDPGSTAVLIGAGFEPVYRKLLKQHPDVIRIGLPQRGGVDVGCDVCHMPMRDVSLDLVLSSSVLEHVYDVEAAVSEMARVLRPGGRVYAEIPFMRAYHMAPTDYQRYTISGIEELFRRHGFTKVEKGICSGPFNTAVLYAQDLLTSSLAFSRPVQFSANLLWSILAHPIKYLDRFCEDASWATYTACNFFYLGERAGRPAA